MCRGCAGQAAFKRMETVRQGKKKAMTRKMSLNFAEEDNADPMDDLKCQRLFNTV